MKYLEIRDLLAFYHKRRPRPTLYATLYLFCFGSFVFCAPLERYIGRHIDRHIGRTLVDMPPDTRPICWPICRLRVIVRLSADMSIDRLPTFHRYFTATCPGCVTWDRVIHIASYHYLRTFWERCLLLPACQRILCINPA